MDAHHEPTWTYSRRVPGWLKAGSALLFLVACAGLPLGLVLGMQVWFQLHFGSGTHWLQPLVDMLPFGEATVIGSLVGLGLLPVIAAFVWPAWLRRRYGSVELHGDQLVFHFALAPPWAKQTVFAEQITARTPTPHGLLLEAEDRWRLAPWHFPLLVPVADEAEQARVLAHLDAAAPDPEAEAVVFGRVLPPRLVLAMVVVPLLLMAPPLAVAGARFGADLFLPFTLGVMFPLLAIMTWVDAWYVQPRYRKLHLGQEALVLANRRIPYADVEWVGTRDRELALSAGKRRLLLRLSEDEFPAALGLLRQRLAARAAPLEIETGLRGWAAPARRRRRLAAALALSAALLAGDMAAAWSDPAIYDDVYVLDDDDQYVRVVYRVTDRLPRLVSLLEDVDPSLSLFLDDVLRVPGLTTQTIGGQGVGAVPQFRLDLEAGRGWHTRSGEFQVDPATRWHHVDALGRRHASTVALPAALTDAVQAARDVALHQASLPALLEPALRDVDDPVVQAFLRGETSRRTYDLRDAEGDRLLWGVAHGEPVFAVLAPADLPLDVRVRTLRHEDTFGGGPVQVRDVGLTWCDPGSNTPLDLGGVPPLATLRRATAAIEAGTPVRRALQDVVGPRLRALAAD